MSERNKASFMKMSSQMYSLGLCTPNRRLVAHCQVLMPHLPIEPLYSRNLQNCDVHTKLLPDLWSPMCNIIYYWLGSSRFSGVCVWAGEGAGVICTRLFCVFNWRCNWNLGPFTCKQCILYHWAMAFPPMGFYSDPIPWLAANQWPTSLRNSGLQEYTAGQQWEVEINAEQPGYAVDCSSPGVLTSKDQTFVSENFVLNVLELF